MKKILLICTGGTIASKNSGRGLAPEIGADGLLEYVPKIKEKYKIETRNLCNIDSTNITKEVWEKIIKIIKTIKEEKEKYDGIVISHGTDTLSYTAAILYYALGDIRKNVVVTGAQLPIENEKTDARVNLADAIEIAAAEETLGVCVVFGGKVIKGNKSKKTDTIKFEAFESINSPLLAEIKEEAEGRRIKWYKEEWEEEQMGEIMDGPINDKVAVLKLVPGIRGDVFEYYFSRYDGVIIEGYGMGGVPKHLEQALWESMEKYKKVKVVMATQVQNGGTDMSIYEVGKATAENKRIKEAKKATIEATFAKMVLEISRDNRE